MLKIQLKDQSKQPQWIAEKHFVLGSDADCHLQHPALEAHHAKLIRQNHHLILRDNHSHSGTSVNGQRVTEKEIFAGDTIKLGSVELVILGPNDAITDAQKNADLLAQRWSLVSDGSWLAGQEFVVPPGISAIGRGKQCEIIIPGTHLSRQHAEFDLYDDQLRIRDLGSSNGTYLNDKRLQRGEYIRLMPGDTLRLDVFTFQVVGPSMSTDSTRLRGSLADSIAAHEVRRQSTDPKLWKTKPTSPGNRDIPPPPSKAPLWAALILAALALLVFAYVAMVWLR